MPHPVNQRFRALDAAFRARAARADKPYVSFAALAALSAPQDVETLIERTFETRHALNAGLGGWRSPGRPLRLVFAAALTAAQRRAGDFFDARQALDAVRRRRGGRTLSHGGSCAALSLVAAGGQTFQADLFFDILEAIATPWWRREPGREEALAASFAARNEAPDEVLRRLEDARDGLVAAGITPNAAEAAAMEIALFDMRPERAASAWTALNTAVRGRDSLDIGVGKAGLAVLAAYGDGRAAADALVEAFECVRAIRPAINRTTAARLARRIAQTRLGRTSPAEAAGELRAALAAQAATATAVAAAAG